MRDPHTMTSTGSFGQGRQSPTLVKRARASFGPAVQGFEVVAILGFVLHCIWVLDARPATRAWPALLLFMGLTIGTAWLHGDRLADLGIRFDNFSRALLEALTVVTPAALIAFAIGRYMEGGRPMNLELFAASFVNVLPWAMFQQYGLQCFFGRRLEAVLKEPVAHDLVCATIFAALHLPNPFLTVVTFGMGYCFCALFRRNRNVFALGTAHALSSAVLYYCLPPAVTHLMRVGPGYILDLRIP